MAIALGVSRNSKKNFFKYNLGKTLIERPVTYLLVALSHLESTEKYLISTTQYPREQSIKVVPLLFQTRTSELSDVDLFTSTIDFVTLYNLSPFFHFI